MAEIPEFWILVSPFIIPAITGLVVLLKKQGSTDVSAAELKVHLETLENTVKDMKADFKESKSDIKAIQNEIRNMLLGNRRRDERERQRYPGEDSDKW